ncbi:MAG: type II toxin-antitoxin system VapC family toxin [Novosphingobium sp.]
MLDSNMVITVALALDDKVRDRMALHDKDDFVTSSIAFAEVLHGSVQGKPPSVEGLMVLIEEVPVLPFDESAAQAYASIPFERGSCDRLIGAHALSLGLTVITANTKHFADVPGLNVENWTE